MTSVFIALVLLPISVQDPTKVRFEHEVGRLEIAIEGLAKATRQKLKVEGAIGNEVVFLSVKDRPLQEVLDKLADVTGGSWHSAPDGTQTLVRSELALKAGLGKIAAARLKALHELSGQLQEGLKFQYTPQNLSKIIRRRTELNDILDKTSDFNSEKEAERYTAALEERESHNVLDPLIRAFGRCMAGIDRSLVANLADNSTLTFSSNPLQGEKALGSGQQTLQILLFERELWVTAMRQMPPKEEGTLEHDLSDGRRFRISGIEPWGNAEPFHAQPTVLEVKATREGNDEVSLELTLLSEAGTQIVAAGVSFPVNAIPDSKPFPIHPFKVLKFGKETVALQELRKRELPPVLKKERIAILQRFFDDPLRNDPLWIGNQDVLSALATQRKQSVIACLTDRAHAMRDSDLNIWNCVVNADANGMEGDLSEDWITLKPKDFSEYLADQSNRAFMAACAEERRTSGKIDLLTFIKLAGSGEYNNFATEFVQLADPLYWPSKETYQVSVNKSANQFLSKLDAILFKRLEAGQTLRFRELSPEMRALAKKVVSTSRTNFQLEGKTNLMVSGNIPGMSLESLVPNITGEIDISATVGTAEIGVLHNQAPPPSDEFAIIPMSNAIGRFIDPVNPNLPPGGTAYATIDFRKRKSIKLRFHLNRDTALVSTFTEPIPPASTKPIPVSELSDKLKFKLKFAFERLDAQGKIERGNRPPPWRP